MLMAGEPRHVLHVLNGAAGGAALSTIGLIEALRARGVESSAVCHDFGSPTRAPADCGGRGRTAADDTALLVESQNPPAGLETPLSELRQLWRTRWKRRSTALVADFARRNAVDLIHSNTILTAEGGLASRQLGLPHVWHVRELVGPGHPYRFASEGPALGRFLQTQAEKVIANSEATATAIRAWLPPGLLEVVPNGIDLPRFVPRRPATRGWPLVVAMVGNLTTRWKNHLSLVRAAGLVDRALPIEWRIYGHDPSDGGRLDVDPYVNRLHEEIRRLGLADRFHLVGFHPDPAEIMAANRHPGSSGRERIVRPDRCRSHGGRAARRRLRGRWRGRDRTSRPDRFSGSAGRGRARWPAMSRAWPATPTFARGWVPRDDSGRETAIRSMLVPKESFAFTARRDGTLPWSLRVSIVPPSTRGIRRRVTRFPSVVEFQRRRSLFPIGQLRLRL